MYHVSMPRFSIYVPDELWERSRATGGVESPSQLVQKALAEMVSRRATSALPLAQGVEIDRERLAKIEAAKRSEVAELYGAGLEHGLRIAEALPFEVLDWLHRFDFDLDRPSDADLNALAEDAGHRHLLEIDELLLGLGLELHAGTVYALGRQHALRSAWEAVMQEPQPGPSDSTS